MIKIQYENELDALVLEIDDELSFVLYKRVIETVFAHPRFRPGINVLYDLRNAPGVSLTTDDVRLVGEYGRAIKDRRGPAWKAAIVVTGLAEYGLGRMFEILNSEAPFKTKVFMDAGEARMWLKQDDGGIPKGG